MHVILVILGGMILFGLFLLFAYLWGVNQPNFSVAIKCFLPIWFIVACINMWVGVTKAGYSFREEFPILLLVFAIPAIVALFAIWRLNR